MLLVNNLGTTKITRNEASTRRRRRSYPENGANLIGKWPCSILFVPRQNIKSLIVRQNG